MSSAELGTAQPKLFYTNEFKSFKSACSLYLSAKMIVSIKFPGIAGIVCKEHAKSGLFCSYNQGMFMFTLVYTCYRPYCLLLLWQTNHKT